MNEQLPTSGPFLLVLDNFEQVLTAAAFVSEMLEACPQLKILVTSRSRLHVYGEHEFPVAPLATDAATELFRQRAAAVRPGFAITEDIASTVEQICARLDGLPLTIELAAARIKVLSPKAILDRLRNSLSLLTGGALDLPERQQTLRNTISWSYGLLKDTEARLFRRMSVFTGGCTLEGAEAVCNTVKDLGIDVLEGLSSLVDQNLVQSTDDEGGNPRFSMLQTIREYAMECLMASGQHAAVKRAQAAYCLVVAEEGNPDLNSNERAGWLAQCDSEVDNFRSALDWLVEEREVEWALRMSMALFRFWDTREHLTEGRSRLEAVLVLAGSDFSKERARVALFIGALATAQGDYSGAENFLGLGLSLNEDLGDELGTAASLNALGIAARDRGDYLAAQTYLERSLACWRVLSDPLAMARCLHNLANLLKVLGDYPSSRWLLREAADKFDEFGDRVGCAWCISQQGDVERSQGRNERARDCYQRALSVFREIGDPWGTGRSLTDLAYIDSSEGNHSAANTECREALEIFSALGHRRGIARTMEACACLAAAQEKNGRAWVLSAGAAHVRQMIGAPLHPTEQQMLDRMLKDAKESLEESRSRQLWDMGFAMSVDEAIRYCFDETRAAATV
jgi:predicted ATPase